RSMVALEKKLKNLAVVEERQRMAREFHDGVGAKMASIVMQCDYIHLMQAEDARLHQEISEIKESAIESIDDMRRSISFLNGDFAIAEQIDLMIEKMMNRHHINIQKNNIDLLQRLSAPQQIACCRIIQEALTNVLKHARAQAVNVTVEKSDAYLSVAIIDDGMGFDPNARTGQQFGIKNMKARAKLIGAQLACYSKPTEGTKIVLEISPS
ncbi:MAG TPA: sensor histidine kinase, partial [Myxococcota bacterium]|nr:sensor histidine kinase [Myxococcota bacterium]